MANCRRNQICFRLACNMFWVSGRIAVLCLFIPSLVRGQTGITGSAQISLIDQGNACGGAGRRVQVYADVTGLEGSGGNAVGINSFVIALTLDRPLEFGSATHGVEPDLAWGFAYTRRPLVQVTGNLVLTGWVAEVNAPNQMYHLATLILVGDPGPVTLTITSVELASRVVNGQNPESFGTVLPAPLSIFLPLPFELSLLEALDFWGETGGDYDLENPPGVNVLDYISIVNCGGA